MKQPVPTNHRLHLLDLLLGILGGVAFLTLVVTYGFPSLPVPEWARRLWTLVLVVGLFLEGIYRLLWVNDPWHYLRRHPVRYLILLMIVLELSGIATWSSVRAGGVRVAAQVAAELFLAVVLLGFIGSWAQGAMLASRWLANRRLSVLALPGLTFGFAILAGSLLLSLPGVHRRPISFLDNLFTSTSALCVTGLAVYDVSSSLNGLGQAVLLLLIQVGGLGTLSLLAMLSLWQRGRLTVGERVAYSELVGGVTRSEARQVVTQLVRYTLITEALGALALGIIWKDRVPHAQLSGAFHAVSAFCNAGFSLFSDNLESFRGDSATLIVVMLLIVAGGAGFPVLADLIQAGSSRILPWVEVRQLGRAARIVLYVSGALIASGAALFLLDAWWTGTERTWMQALFQSVTLRTAGFQAESQMRFGTLGILAAVALMLVGASPQSTGGGIKTTVLARLFRDFESGAAGRFIVLKRAFRTALLLAAGYVLCCVLGAQLLMLTDGLDVREAAYEASSALGTVGLSLDVTPRLSASGKCIDILLMFVGRVIYPTFVLWLIRRRKEAEYEVPWT